MRLIRIGIGNLDPTVGDFTANTDALIGTAAMLSLSGCTVASFPEGSIGGYPCEDLVQWPSFVANQWQQLKRFSNATKYCQTIFTLGLAVEHDGHIYNAVAVVFGGQILGIVPKEKLAAGNVFYDDRTYSRGWPGMQATIESVPFGDLLFEFPFGVMAVQVCEDIWSANGPTERQAYSGAELIINHSASPYRAGVVQTREELLRTRSAESQSTIVYVNQVGANDGLVFDGGGYVIQNGRPLNKFTRWRIGADTTQVVDLDVTKRHRFESNTWRADAEQYLRTHLPVQRIVCKVDPKRPEPAEYPHQPGNLVFLPPITAGLDPRMEYFEDLLQAMKWALKDYFEKTGAFQRIGISLSGGKDSALTLIVAWRYAQERFAELRTDPEAYREAVADFIHCFSFPTVYNSPMTRRIARQLCRQMGVSFKEIRIDRLVKMNRRLQQAMLGPEQPLTANSMQNDQPRLRATLMWNWSNAAHGMFLQPGNMSEKAVGYTTIGGDLMGAYSLIGNLPKTVVIELLHYLRQQYTWPVLDLLLKSKASAELADGQEDEKDLMPFPVLDACMQFFAGEKMSAVELYQAVRAKWTDEDLRQFRPGYQPGTLKAWVKMFLVLFMRSIFKWVQAPPTAHLGSTDYDRERAFQIPIVQKTDWLEIDKLDNLPD